MPAPTPRLRPASAADSEACFGLFWDSITDLAARNGTPWDSTLDEQWPRFTDLYSLLADVAAEWWIAEDPGSGVLLGYARSVERGEDARLFELAEFFVRPGNQAAGVGRQLLQRAFPVGRGDIRTIIATGDVRALSRYHRADTAIQFPILGMTGAPSAPAADRIGLDPEPMRPIDLDEVAAMERTVLEVDRGGRELAWLLEQREGWCYRQDGRLAGTAFVGRGGIGPIAAATPDVVPTMLAHVEARAAALGREEIGFEVPGPNVTAIRYLLSRGYRFDAFVTYLMANRPFGRFDRYLGFTPPFVL